MLERLDAVRSDLAAFADDDEEVVIEPRGGLCVLVRGGETIEFSLEEQEGALFVVESGTRLQYRQFLMRRLARLDVLAERMVAKRQPLKHYVRGAGRLDSSSANIETGDASTLLADQCGRHAAFLSRVLFITADAGQGKTALLRQHQFEQAGRYLTGEADYLFWHVDLQGRQLLRLSEALMGDLGELRFSGLWVPGIISLLRHRAIVLAIDGFDELAAEQGSTDALGALALLVQQMGDRGTIVAASRRAFFDTEDYISRSKMFARAAGGECEFNQLALCEWGPAEAKSYLAKVDEDGVRFPDSVAIYDAIVAELKSPEHPMVTRPFLLAQIARALLRFDMTAAEFIRGMDDPYRGVGAVIEAFVKREVEEKWKQQDTGEPYLTSEEHLRFLADVAEEMFRAQRSSLDIDVVETIAMLLLEEWGKEQSRRQQIVDMVKMHVLLPPPTDGGHDRRTFGHEEFQSWFLAYALKDRLMALASGSTGVRDLLSIAPLSDSTASYACALLERTPETVRAIAEGLTALVDSEWRPTYLQANTGTLIPYLLSNVEFEDELRVDAKVIYSSLVLESSTLTGVTFVNGSFINASFAEANWSGVTFQQCSLGEPTLSKTASYANVTLLDCNLDGLRVLDKNGEETREYAPARVQATLKSLGISVASAQDGQLTLEAEAPVGETRRLVNRVLGLFRRTTTITETTIKQRFSRDAKEIIGTVMPLMQEYGVVKLKPWKGAGRQLAWGAAVGLDRVERADGLQEGQLSEFWVKVDELG